MSGSDSDADCCWEDSRHRSHVRYDTVIALRPSEEVYDQWLKISADTKREAGQRMKICAFWLPILLQPDVSSTTANWAVEIGLIKFKNSDNISMKQLHKIEILEAILRAMERGSVERNQTKHIFSLSNMFNLRSHGVLDDALRWLERTGEPAIRSCVMELGHAHTCYTALHLIFTEFAKYVQDMGSKLEKTMKALMAQPSQYHIEKCEEMKKKGNEKFSEQRYEEAVKFYSKAIKYWPDNHLIYGNRALCYIKCEMWLKAVGDGKRAMLIKPVWAKGHYRYCDALFSMGAVRKAIDANKSAQILCKNDNEGLKDLEQQFFKFTSSMADPKAAQPTSKNKRVGLDTKKMPQNKVPEDKMQNQPVKNERIAQMKERTKDPKPMKSEFSNDGKAEHTATTKKKERKNRDIQSENDNKKVSDNKAAVCRELRSLVQDAHTALADLRSRNAEQAFSQALALLETTTPKELGLSTVDLLLLLYGRVSTLTEIGQSEELSEAQKLIEKMKSFEERTFQCLVYYAAGRLYLKENRFAVALEQFSDSLQMVKNQITPGKLTWPLTKEIVKETQLDNFKEILECAIEFCKFPPNPDAICRLNKCHSSLKTEIYLTDPDFKGFIKICCCQSCTVEYHIMCWKTLKTSNFFEKNEKDFLQEPCLTPDCVGQICSIKIYGPTGLVKCKFEASIPKAQTPKKPKLNQKCTSLKKLKSKEARRLKRKQHKQSFQDKQDISDENLQQKETSASQSEQKAWLVYRDRVLLQISQNMELLREETNLHVSVLITNLRPWLELDSTRGNQLAEKVLNWEREQLKSLGQAVELLLERKNRVWARVLIQLLSSCLDINSKLNKWACRLNDAGLNAAKLFVERYAGDLEQLDLAPLLNFGPLQEMIIEKLGTKPELFSGLGLSVTDYLKQASPHDMRLFIWTMEEHRDDYLSCHSILDQYFDMMDGQFSVLKKSDENENNSPMKGKSRGRKKKQNQKGVFVLSGMRGPTPRDEWEQDIFEDDSLSFLHPVDSFSVPSHLRDQVADFEDQYNSSRHRSRYKKILDNNPDPTKESLYDYFAQILEEHGPLVAEDPLLVGELENFPHMAQLKIQEAGGFESFLLESLRFIKMGRSIGLAKHAVSLQQGEHGASLDDLDIILDPDTNFPSPDLYEAPITNYANYVDTFPPTQTEAYHIFPNPYQFPCQPVIASAEFPSSNWSNDDGELGPYVPNNEYLLWDELVYESDEGVFGGCATSFTTEENIFKKHAAAQTCPETMSSVAVNTEFHERFESCQGDMNKKEKDNRKLEQQIVEMIGGCDRVNLKHKEDIDSLEEDIHKINVNIQVTNKELALFHQKLEEEVKKDQKEKKANQETLKSLKLEIEGLVEEQGSLVRNIREKKASYDTKFRDFLELGNQSAAEKMSLEDEIKHCRDLFASATRRSHNAQLSVMESGRDQGLYSLYRELADAKSLLTKLDEAVQKFRNQDLEITRNSCRANVQEIEKKISTAETQYQEQIDQAKLRCEMPPVNINNQPKAPAPTLSAPARAPSSVQPPHRTPPLIHESAAEPQAASAQTQHKPPPITVFDKSMERLSAIFPDYTKSDLMRFVQEFRSSSGGSLGNMALQDVVSGVTQRILDHQEKLNAVRSSVVGRRSPAQCPTPPLVNPVPVWQPVVSQRPTHPNAINMEDPCIICHDDMSPDDMCVLECRHSFHNECIRSWLKEQSTCPTCRDHALLPDDFPVLPGRRRQAP